MKIKRKKNNKKKLVIIIAAIALLITVYGFASYHYKFWPFIKSADIDLNNSDSTNDQQKSKTAEPVKGVDTTKSSTDTPVSDTISLNITKLEQVGLNISYSADITNPADKGVCTATFTKSDSRTLVYDVTTTNSKCEMASISANDFDSMGEWTMTLRYFADDSQAVATKKIDIK